MLNPTVLITGDTDPLRKALALASRDLQRFGVDSLQAFTGINAGTLSVAALAAGLSIATKRAVDMADSIGKLSERTGIATETLSAYRLGAELADVSNEDLVVSLRKLAVNIDGAARGNLEAASGFNRLGISVNDSSGKLRSTNDVLEDVAEAFAKLEDGPTKAAIAVQLFGRSGDKIIPFLNAGRAGMEAMRTEAESLGLLVGKETADAAQQFNDDVRVLGEVTTGVGLQIGSGLLPALTGITEAMRASVNAGSGWRSVGERLGVVMRGLAAVVTITRSAFVQLGLALGASAAAGVAVATGNFGRAKSIIGELGADLKNERKSTAAELKALTDDAIAATLKRATAEAEAAKAEKGRAAERVASEKAASKEIVDVRNAERRQLIEVLSAQVSAEKQAAKDIEEARRNLVRVEADNKRFLAEIAAGPQKPVEDLQGIDVQGQLAKAREAFRTGDFESAAALAAKVKENLLALSRAGKESGDVLSFLSRQAVDLDKAIAQQHIDDLTDQLKRIRVVIDETLGKAITLQFNLPESRKNLNEVLAALKKQAEDGVVVVAPAKVINTSLTDEERARVLAGQALAGGGLLRGPGTGTSDSILARVSAGEYVVRAAAVQRYGVSMMEAINGMLLPRFAVGGAVAAGGRLSERGGPTHTLNFNLGDSGSFSLRASQAEADSVTAVFERLALQRGRRR